MTIMTRDVVFDIIPIKLSSKMSNLYDNKEFVYGAKVYAFY